jgi:hypothetical protein
VSRTVICKVRSREKTTKNQKKIQIQWSVGKKKKDYDEPHLAPNENMQPIQWTERPTGALVDIGSLWPLRHSSAAKRY